MATYVGNIIIHQHMWKDWKNTPRDLHNEHLNKLCKEMFNNEGANTSEAAITRAARSVSVTVLQEPTLIQKLEYILLVVHIQHSMI